jgi:hypothetical protein
MEIDPIEFLSKNLWTSILNLEDSANLSRKIKTFKRWLFSSSWQTLQSNPKTIIIVLDNFVTSTSAQIDVNKTETQNLSVT